MIESFQTLVSYMQQNIWVALFWMGVLWGIHLINFLLGYLLNIFGIYPRHIWGIIGIPCSPFLHGDFNHLFFNSIPLFVLMSFLLLFGRPVFYCVSTMIILLSGVATWVGGRKGIHIGASALIMGYWSFLLFTAYEQRTVMTLVIAIISLYYFGGLIMNLLPGEVKVSWEGHVFGFLAGVATVFILFQWPWIISYFS